MKIPSAILHLRRSGINLVYPVGRSGVYRRWWWCDGGGRRDAGCRMPDGIFHQLSGVQRVFTVGHVDFRVKSVGCLGLHPHPTDWVIALLKELSAEGKDNLRCASLITDAGYDCSARQVHRWKVKRGIRRIWRGDDQALDGIIARLKANDELGPLEGHSWVHSVVNDAIPGAERVGRNRVCAGCMPDDG